MNEPDESRIEPHLIETLRDISCQKGVPVSALINMAVKEFIYSMDDDMQMYGLPQRSGDQYWLPG